MALVCRPNPGAAVTTQLPPEIKEVGRLRPTTGTQLAYVELVFYLDQLKKLSRAHTLPLEYDSGLLSNGGLGSVGYILGDEKRDVPRATLVDSQGELEILVEACKPGAGPAFINIYSTEPERARSILSEHFRFHQ